MSRFTDLFQEPESILESIPEPVKVEEIVAKKPVINHKDPKKKFTKD